MIKKIIKGSIVLLSIVLICIFTWQGISTWFNNSFGRFFQKQTTEVVIKCYQRMGMLFLVTTRDSIRSIVNKFDRNIIIGNRQLIQEAEVVAYWGIDCRKITRDIIQVMPDRIVITLPDPELLDFRIKLGSRKEFIKETALRALLDGLSRDDPAKDRWTVFESIVERRLHDNQPSKEMVLARLAAPTRFFGTLLDTKIKIR